MQYEAVSSMATLGDTGEARAAQRPHGDSVYPLYAPMQRPRRCAQSGSAQVRWAEAGLDAYAGLDAPHRLPPSEGGPPA